MGSHPPHSKALCWQEPAGLDPGRSKGLAKKLLLPTRVGQPVSKGRCETGCHEETRAIRRRGGDVVADGVGRADGGRALGIGLPAGLSLGGRRARRRGSVRSGCVPYWYTAAQFRQWPGWAPGWSDPSLPVRPGWACAAVPGKVSRPEQPLGEAPAVRRGSELRLAT